LTKLAINGGKPISENLSECILSLPMHPYLSDEELQMVVESIEKVANYYHK
jgi:dTDP-4-amino-4,6-dideoxygalactose transaminase